MEVELNPRVGIKDGEIIVADNDAKKCDALQLKMCCLAEQLFPEKGASVPSAGDICYTPNICTSEADFPGDKHYDKTYKPLPPPASNSDSEASIPSILFDDEGDEVVIVGRVSVHL